MKTRKLIVAIFMAFYLVILGGCGVDCSVDYTSTIHSIMLNMKMNLKDFYESERSYPDVSQRDALLEASGCEIVDAKRQQCRYENIIFEYGSNVGILYPDDRSKIAAQATCADKTTTITQKPPPQNAQEVYTIAISREKSHCTMDMTDRGEMLPIECRQDSCLEIDP